MTKQNKIADDDLITAARERLKAAQGRVRWSESRLAEVRATIVRGDGSVRPFASKEAATRAEELAALKARETETETALADAIADLPRREAERKKAAEADREAVRINGEAGKVREKLAALEADEAGKLAEAEAHRKLASMTQKQLDERAAEQRRAAEREQAETERRQRMASRTVALNAEAAAHA